MGPAEGRPGILLVALGAPDSLSEVPGFLSAIRRGRPTPPGMVAEFVERYREIGGGSPLNRIGRNLAQRLEERMELGGRPVACRYATLHGGPSIEEGWADLLGAGATGGVCLPLTPFYTPWGVGQYLARVRAARRARGERRPMVYLTGWHSANGLARAWARRIRAASERLTDRWGEPPALVFSAHSLPDRPGEPPIQYTAQIDALRARIVTELPPHRVAMAYQSVGRSDGPWLGPAVESVTAQLLREATAPVLLAPIGFIADNLEILYDLDLALRRRLGEAAGRLDRVPSFNADDDLVAILEELVRPALPSVLGGRGPEARRRPPGPSGPAPAGVEGGEDSGPVIRGGAGPAGR
ncbi:MAG: ferrochelatase [Thermoplasmata archaeon]